MFVPPEDEEREQETAERQPEGENATNVKTMDAEFEKWDRRRYISKSGID